MATASLHVGPVSWTASLYRPFSCNTDSVTISMANSTSRSSSLRQSTLGLAEQGAGNNSNMQPDDDVEMDTCTEEKQFNTLGGGKVTDRDFGDAACICAEESALSSERASDNFMTNQPTALGEPLDVGINADVHADTESNQVQLAHRLSQSSTMGSMILAMGSWRTNPSFSLQKSCATLLSSGAKTLSAGAKTVSAGLYVLDYVSNVLVLREYYILGTEGKYEGRENMDFIFSGLGIFYACLALMLFDPVVVAAAFQLKLPQEERPLRSAFFLPIVQFYRFVTGVFQTGFSSRAIQTTESLDTESLYAIMSAIGTGPQLVLQSAVIAIAGSTSYYDHGSEKQWKPSSILILSITASFLSAAYNVGRAVMYQMSKKWTFILNGFGVVGGMYTIGVVFLRCSAVVSTVQDSRFWFIIVYMVAGIGLCSHINGWLVCFSKGQKMCSWIALVEVLIFGYMSATIGPLYPIIEGDNVCHAKGSSNDQKSSLPRSVGLVVGINMLPDVLALAYLIIHQRTTCHIKPDSSSVTFDCSCFIGFLATGVVLSILPCFFFFYIFRSNSTVLCEGHVGEVLIHRELIVDL